MQEPNYDIDTEETHISPLGMEHHVRRNKGKGKWYADIKMRHFLIKAHQDAFPELADQMRNNPDATNLYSAFLAILPLQIKGKLTPELRKKILKTYKLVD